MFPYDPTLETPHGQDLNPVDHPVVCPQIQYFTNPLNGKKTRKVWRCNDKRNCPNCQKLEADQYKARMWRAYQQAEEAGDRLVYAVILTDTPLNEEIKKKIGKEGRWSLPLSTGETYHIMRLSEAQKLESLAECQPVTKEIIPQMDYASLVNSPAREKHGTGGKQASGSLGKPKTPAANKEETVVIEVITFSTDLDRRLQEEADREVYEATKDFQPKTFEEGKEFADRVTTLRMRLYEARGGRISNVGKYDLRVPKNVSINWGHRNILGEEIWGEAWLDT